MNLKNELQSLHDDSKTLTEVDTKAMVALVKEYMPELTNNTKSIAEDFGDTLMKSLKNPNGQAVKIKNTHRNGHTNYNDGPPMFVVGKQFGVANVARSSRRFYYDSNPKNVRYMSTYFSNSQLISHLQQEHVDGIKRASQQEVAQAYLDFSKQFEKVINKTNEEVYHTSVNIPIVMCQKTNVRFSRVVENSMYGASNTNEYTFFNDEDKKNVVVTDIITRVGDRFQRWNPADRTGAVMNSTDIVIMHLFGYVDGGKEKKDLGNIRIQNGHITYNATYYRLHGSNVDKYNKLVLKHDLPKNPENIGMTILTKCAITNDDTVKGLMEKINTFYRMSRKTMKYVQMKFADRILFNGAF